MPTQKNQTTYYADLNPDYGAKREKRWAVFLKRDGAPGSRTNLQYVNRRDAERNAKKLTEQEHDPVVAAAVAAEEPGPAARNTKNADKIIDLYRTLTNDDDEDIVADLLGDLMHWCDVHRDLNTFDEALRRAGNYYADEATDPKPGAE